MEDLTPLAPDASLYAFMDGELERHNEQALFDELAANSELRTEMKDLLAIRNAIHTDILSPSAFAESGVLATVGVASVAQAAVGTGLGFWASASPIAYVAGGVLAGVAIAAMFMSGNTNLDAIKVMAQAPQRMEIRMPRAGNEVTTKPTENIPPRIIVVFRDAPTTNTESATPMSVAESSERPLLVEPLSTTQQPAPRFVQTLQTRAENPITEASPLSPMISQSSTSPVRIRIRSLASGVPSTEATPASIRDNLLPNTAFAFTMPINEHHRVGLEMASESFRQVFIGTFDGRSVTFTQTPTLFWMGATYQWTPMEFSFLDGLRPYAELTAGLAFNQGPIGQATVGLAYSPTGPVTFTAGINTAALLFRHQNASYSSTKWGMTYGLSVDLGRMP